MRITGIKREKGHLVRVTAGDASVLLDSDLAAEKCIREGDDISRETLREYLSESEYRRAKARALWLLDRYTYTERRLMEKLRSAGFDPRAAQRAVDRLRELGVIDDADFGNALAEECARRGMSGRAAYAKLISKGLSSDVAKAAIDNAGFEEAEQLAVIIERKYAAKLAAGETQKVFEALVRKGFSYGAVRGALKKYTDELNMCEDF